MLRVEYLTGLQAGMALSLSPAPFSYLKLQRYNNSTSLSRTGYLDVAPVHFVNN
jgi:hypothetical protein